MADAEIAQALFMTDSAHGIFVRPSHWAVSHDCRLLAHFDDHDTFQVPALLGPLNCDTLVIVTPAQFRS